MNNLKTTISTTLAAWALIFLGCATTRYAVNEPLAPEKPSYNREALSHVIKGAIVDLLGRPRDALVEYQQAIQIDSSSAGIYQAMAEDYLAIGELRSAVRMLRQATRLDPDYIEAHEILASTYAQMHRIRQATDTYKKLTELDPNNTKAHYRLMSLLIMQKEFPQAVEVYKTLVTMGFEDVDFRQRIGNLFLKAGAYDQAEEIYLDINSNSPDDEVSYLGLAALCKAKQDTLGAIDWYLRALDKNPNFRDAKAELRNLYIQSDRIEQAIALYENLVQRDSTNIGNKLQLGQLYFDSGDTLNALKTFESTTRDHPNSERAHLAFAAMYKILELDDKAEQIYLNALEVNPQFDKVRERLRDLYVDHKRWNDAIALYQELAATDTSNVGVSLEIANLHFLKGDSLQAIDMCIDLKKKHPKDWRITTTLGRMYFSNGELNKAVANLDEAIKLNGEIPGLWVMRGLAFMRSDSLDQAEKNFQQALKIFPDDPELNYYLGSILNQRHKPEQAIVYLEKSLQNDPESLQTMVALAGSYDELQQYDKSEEYYVKILKRNPNNPVLLNNYSYHLSVRGIRLDEALEMVLKALEAQPNNAAFLDTAGWIYYKMGDYEKAQDYILKSIETERASAEVFEHLGDVYEKMGDIGKARASWQDGLEIDGGRESLLEKLERTNP